MRILSGIRAMRWWQTTILAIALIAVLYTCAGFFLAPVVMKGMLEQSLGKALDHRVSIKDVDVNPYRLSIRLEEVTVTDSNRSTVFASLAECYANLSFATVYHRYPVVQGLVMRRPVVRIVRNEDGSFNLPDLNADRGAEEAASGEPARFALHNIEIHRGEVLFSDRPADREHVLEDIHLSVPLISNVGEHVETWVEPSFSAVINESGVSITGRSKPFTRSRNTRIQVSLEAIDLPKYMVYAPQERDFDITSGRLELDAEISFLHPPDEASDVVEISADLLLTSLEIEQPGKSGGLRLPSMRVRIGSLKPFHRTVTIDSVSLLEPEVRLHREESGELTMLSGSGTATTSPTEPADKGQGEWRFHLERGSVVDGAFLLTDASVEDGFAFALDPFDLDIRSLGNQEGTVASFTFSGTNDAGLELEADGDLVPSPFSSEGKVAISGLLLNSYRPYYRESIGAVLGGNLDVEGRYRFASGDAGVDLELSEVGCSLDSFNAAPGEEAEDVIRIPSLQVEGGSLQLADQRIDIRTIRAQDGFAAVTRRKDGSLNLEDFILPGAREDRLEESKPPWRFMIHKGSMERFEILFEDKHPAQPVKLRLASIRSELEGLTNEKEGEASVALGFRLNERGSFQASGAIDLVPLRADLAMKLDAVDLSVLQPYLDHPGLRLASGDLSVAGDLLWSMEEGKPVLSYEGRAGVSGLSLVEKQSGQELISWKNTELSGLDLGNEPVRFHLDTMNVQGVETTVSISEKGKLNLIQAFSRRTKGEGDAKGETTDHPSETEESSPVETVRIGKVKVSDSHISFSDHHIHPPVQAELMNVRGTITGLSSAKGGTAEVNLQGNVTGNAPLEIVGEVGALAEGVYVDVGLNLKGVSLVHMNPYARQYVGYAVEKGNMSLDLKYLIDRNKLDSSNQVLLDQLTLGEKVESAAAIDLPVKFAVALLKDRHGRIHLSIPVKGELDDPKTDLGGVIQKAVTGFLKKVISAPFSFLGALFGQGEELQYIVFPYGSSALTDKAEEKLRTLSTALGDRPQLEVAVTGYVDREGDALALAEEKVLADLGTEGQEGGAVMDALILQAFIDRFCTAGEEPGRKGTLKPEAIKRLFTAWEEKGASSGSGTASEVQDESSWRERLEKLEQNGMDEPAALQALFRREFCDATIGVGTRFPTGLMKSLLVSSTTVTEKELSSLAKDRAEAVRRFLYEKPEIDSDRLFLKETSSLSPEDKADVKASRVRLELEAR